MEKHQHWIADDNMKEKCPTFNLIVDRIRRYFGIVIDKTRFNWYKNQEEWKPYHHDAYALNSKSAKT